MSQQINANFDNTPNKDFEIRSYIDKTKMSAICLDDMDDNFKYKSTEKPVVMKEQISAMPDAPQHDNLISTEKGANDEL